jgi:hypothetical protein
VAGLVPATTIIPARVLKVEVAGTSPATTPVRDSKPGTMKLANQVAIVTGAGRNIGEEISKNLGGRGRQGGGGRPR